MRCTDEFAGWTFADERALQGVSAFAAVGAAIYTLYPGYYAVGGTAGMLGVPVSQSEFRYINAVATIALAAATVLPLLLLRAWRAPGWRAAALTLCCVIIVGCVGHALVGISQRVLSLTGILTMSYPFWLTIDRAKADWQALLWNEPWFVVEGLSWHAMAWTAVVRDASWRGYWNIGLLIAVLVFTVIGLLSAFGIVGRVIVG
jgi:hypothetical protein